MHGLGNDFAVFDARNGDFTPGNAQIRAFGHRKTGLGFDQMVILRPGNVMEIYNADGSEVSACGNATRCVAALLMDETKKDGVVLKTKAGELACWRAGEKIGVDMGPARLAWNEIPLSHEMDTLSLPVAVGLLKNPVGVGMGNPHAVFFVDDIAGAALEEWGPKIEHHALFPERVNVEAAQVLSRNKIRMRVWERGTGVTMACGTGACATAVAAVRRGLTERKVSVVLDGGALDIEWRESDGHVLMVGPVATAYRGEVDV
jgi:diaminopimelate epimerase